MNALVRTLAVAAAAAFVAPSAADDKDAKGADPRKLEGVYSIESGQKNGQPIPAEQVKGSVVSFAANKVVGTDKDRKEFFAATYTLDTDKSPWVIRMTSTDPKPGTSTTGVIKLEGDTVTICYALPGGPIPSDFQARDKQQCFVLKRIEK
jgi:uncharacterized protein (TIGR03067 family)